MYDLKPNQQLKIKICENMSNDLVIGLRATWSFVSFDSSDLWSNTSLRLWKMF